MAAKSPTKPFVERAIAKFCDKKHMFANFHDKKRMFANFRGINVVFAKGWGAIAKLKKKQELLVRFGYNLGELFRDSP